MDEALKLAIKEYLKENLRLNVQQKGGGYDGEPYISVELYLEEELVTESCS